MSNSSSVLIEVCVDSVASAVAAERGGANRIELCGSLIEGGITPSAGLIAAVRSAVQLPLHVMIRPRGGDFCYDDSEFDVMRRDLTMARQLKVSGAVFGILDADGSIDVARTRQLVEMARPLETTFHRAFDMAADLSHALEAVCATGANRLLTSGGEPTSLKGVEKIAQLVQQSGGRIVVMPGSGIKPESARGLVERTGATEIHVGLRAAIPSPMRSRKSGISMGSAGREHEGREYDRFVVLEETVRKLRDALA